MEVRQTIKERYRLLACEYEQGGTYAEAYSIIFQALHNDLGILRPLETLRLEYLKAWKQEREASDLLEISQYNTVKKLLGEVIDELHYYLYIAEE